MTWTKSPLVNFSGILRSIPRANNLNRRINIIISLVEFFRTSNSSLMNHINVLYKLSLTWSTDKPSSTKDSYKRKKNNELLQIIWLNDIQHAKITTLKISSKTTQGSIFNNGLLIYLVKIQISVIWHQTRCHMSK